MSGLKEGEFLELKERWADRAFEGLAAFANTGGGTCLIGVKKDGTVVGADTSVVELQRIANIVVRTPLPAQTFYYANLIERLGTETTRFMNRCQAQGFPEPEFVEQSGSFKVVFLKDP
jgi:predicted HTH transcriptional regulator